MRGAPPGVEMDSQPEEDHEAKVEEGVEDPDTPSIEAAAGSHPRPALHHLTRHWLPEDERGEGVLERFGAPTLEAARHMVRYVLAYCGVVLRG